MKRLLLIMLLLLPVVLFAAGDIRIDAPKQVVCAAGDGAVAGIGAHLIVNL